MRWRPAADIAWELDPEQDLVCVMQLPTGQPILLAGSAASIWLALAETPGGVDVVESMAQLYGVPAADIADDVEAALRSLADQGLVEPVASTRD